MALVKTFSEKRMERPSLHKPISADYYLIEKDGKKLFQLNTSGTTDREKPGKISQSIQLDVDGAERLYDILGRFLGK